MPSDDASLTRTVLVAAAEEPDSGHAAVVARRLFAEDAAFVTIDLPSAGAREMTSVVLDAAHERRAHVIVLGAHDRGWFDRLFDHSSTRHVVAASDVPVVVVHRPEPTDRRSLESSALAVMIATDGGPGPLHAARVAAQLFGPRARYEVVSVAAERPDPNADADGFAGPLLSEGEADQVGRESLANADEAVATTADLVAAALIDHADATPASRTVLVGDAATVLCDYARDTADVLVLGSSGTGRLLHLVVGSVSSHVLAHCEVPVLVVPAPTDSH